MTGVQTCALPICQLVGKMVEFISVCVVCVFVCFECVCTVEGDEGQELEERLRCSRPENGKSRASRRRCSEPDAASSPGSPDAACDDAGDVPGAKIARKEDEETNGLCVFGTLDSL